MLRKCMVDIPMFDKSYLVVENITTTNQDYLNVSLNKYKTICKTAIKPWFPVVSYGFL